MTSSGRRRHDAGASVEGALETPHSLKEKGVRYEEVPLKDNAYDLAGIEAAVAEKQPKLSSSSVPAVTARGHP